MDFKNFPFDYQFCTLDFHLVEYSLRHINLKWSQRFKDKVVLISEFNLGDLKPTNKYITIKVSRLQILHSKNYSKSLAGINFIVCFKNVSIYSMSHTVCDIQL